ncbi:MAG: cyclopropane fatty acid synthase [Planctomycetaceae bacterium]|nr:cyclopropane fatty acid synthase [Planctomycetaceae bacterium]
MPKMTHGVSFGLGQEVTANTREADQLSDRSKTTDGESAHRTSSGLTDQSRMRSTGGLSNQSSTTSLRHSYHIERTIAWMLHSRIGRPDVQIALWDGTSVGNAGRSIGRVVIRQPWVLWRLLVDSEIAFGKAYTNGDLELEGDLIPVLTEMNIGLTRVPRKAGLSRLFQPLRLTGKRSRQTPTESRASVYHHYDIGNEFYKLWLDQQLIYTCAYYTSATDSLEAAQTAKLDYVCRKLRLQPGETVVEAGCGWGALALHMARHYGVAVKAYNLSREQLAYARERARAEGLADRVEFVEADYRDIEGQFDVFVSVGMLEHVGPKNYTGMGNVMRNVLTAEGRGLIHSIGRNFAAPLDAWIERHIFPGACPASLKEMMDLFESSGFSVVDVENLRLHYARTCADWLKRLEEQAERVTEMFDLEFLRMWRLYLAGSSAAFLSGWLQLFQIVFTRATNNRLPWTRSDWYSSFA